MNSNNFRSVRLKKVYKQLGKIHKAQTNFDAMRRQKARDAGQAEPLSVAFDLEKAMKSVTRKWCRDTGNTSKYTPHQGEQECARRRKQMEAKGVNS